MMCAGVAQAAPIFLKLFEMINELVPVFCEEITGDLEEGKIYISEKYSCAIHLCACGCKQKTVTPFNNSREWTLTNKNGLITLRPSIGNFAGEKS